MLFRSSVTSSTTTTIAALPVATVNNPSVCIGTTSNALTVTASVGTPTTYAIDYDAAANTAGFVDVAANTTIAGATYVIPAAPTGGAATFNGTITYTDEAGCTGP